MKIAIGILVVLIVSAFGSLFWFSGHTALEIRNPPAAVGETTPVTIVAANPHGVRTLTAYVEQGGTRQQVFTQNAPAVRFLWKRHQPPQTFTFDIGKSKAPQIKEGKLRLVVEAVSNDFRASTDSTSHEFDVVLAPPRVSADGLEHIIYQGSMELVLLTTGGSVTDSGVRVGSYTFRSFPLPGHGPDQRFCMFGYPWDVGRDAVPQAFARNQTGTEVTTHFRYRIKPRKFREREFVLTDSLLATLVNSVDPTGKITGPDLLSRFLKINGDLRRQNNQQLADLRFKTEEKMLWNGPFIHYGKEEAHFADVRDYMYHGKQVDKQVHLGFDLSDVADAPVSAANDGRVVWASDLGIYGNCIVVDHGYALQSIYGHLKSISVKVGDMVKKGQPMGIAGSTGLAGGVHVHFSMQIDGVQTDPREWWDEHWIKDRILSKLQ